MHTLDQIDGWTLTVGQASKDHNDLAALSVVWFGLEHLCSTVLLSELRAKPALCLVILGQAEDLSNPSDSMPSAWSKRAR